MIDFKKRQLSNGLTIIAHTDMSTPMASVNVLYKVGARNELYEQTGLAHLFEHLMFGGSRNVPDFDAPLQLAGGENNAFTNNDYTNYYVAIPAENIRTALWVESDRMRGLAINEHSLQVQRRVVVEEFAQRYLNEPYGDVWSLLRPLCYGERHPYSWPTIGREASHIENVQLPAVQAFYDRYYQPSNAILSIAAPMATDKIFELAHEWFGSIENTAHNNTIAWPAVPCGGGELTVERDVPASVVYICFPTAGRLSAQVTALDVVSDILSEGASSRLVQRLVKDRALFSSVNAYISGDEGPGLFVVTGRLMKETTMEAAQDALWAELQAIANQDVSDYELQKVRNKAVANDMFSHINSMNKAMNLAYFEFLGAAELINDQISLHHAVSKDDIRAAAAELFTPDKAYTLRYMGRG